MGNAGPEAQIPGSAPHLFNTPREFLRTYTLRLTKPSRAKWPAIGGNTAPRIIRHGRRLSFPCGCVCASSSLIFFIYFVAY